MNQLLFKAVHKLPILDADIAQELYEICDREHANCNPDCPVYAKNGNRPVGNDAPFSANRGCDCFKDGKAMLHFLRA